MDEVLLLIKTRERLQPILLAAMLIFSIENRVPRNLRIRSRDNHIHSRRIRVDPFVGDDGSTVRLGDRVREAGSLAHNSGHSRDGARGGRGHTLLDDGHIHCFHYHFPRLSSIRSLRRRFPQNRKNFADPPYPPLHVFLYVEDNDDTSARYVA